MLLTFFCKHLTTFICHSCLFRLGTQSSQCCCTTRTESWSICLWSTVDWLSSHEAEWRGAPQPTGFSSCMFSDLLQILLLKRHLDRVLFKFWYLWISIQFYLLKLKFNPLTHFMSSYLSLWKDKSLLIYYQHCDWMASRLNIAAEKYFLKMLVNATDLFSIDLNKK